MLSSVAHLGERQALSGSTCWSKHEIILSLQLTLRQDVIGGPSRSKELSRRSVTTVLLLVRKGPEFAGEPRPRSAVQPFSARRSGLSVNPADPRRLQLTTD